MDLFTNLAIGVQSAFTPYNVLYCFVGCLLGTLIGVLPGLGPAATIAMLLPITYAMDPTASLIMLAGIYYGAQYGGSTTAILVNLPGETSSLVTVLDGYQLTRKGRAGLALSTAAIGSFVAGTVATLVVAMFAPYLARAALEFGSAEYFSLMVLGLVISVVLAQGSLLNAFAMIFAGLLVGVVGIDIYSGVQRLNFGVTELADGVSIVAVAMGIFGLGEIIDNLASDHRTRSVTTVSWRKLWPSRDEFREMSAPILRGTMLGSVLGLLPGGGAMLSSFASYALEKRISSEPATFGKGALAGVAGPESANNAGAQTSFIPMLTLGIPSNVIMALMIGAMIIQGIQPGPSVMVERPQLFWGLIVSMWLGNLMLVVLNLPLVGLWVRLLTIPYRYLFPSIMVIAAIGVFSIKNSVFDVYVMIFFGFLGLFLKRIKCEPTPFILAMVLGPMLEEHFRRAMLLSRGDPFTFVERPLSAAMLVLTVGAIALVLVPAFRKTRDVLEE